MFRLGASTAVGCDVGRPLAERIASAGYAAMAYWYYRWDWGESIALDGLLLAGSTMDCLPFRWFVAREVAGWLTAAGQDRGDPHGPATALLDLLDGREDHSSRWWPDGAGRAPDPAMGAATLTRLVDNLRTTGREVDGLSPHGPDSAIFVDALYGYPALAVRWGLRCENPEMVDEAVALTRWHCAALQSERTGLFRHFATREEHRDPAVPWGRGNGWAVLGLSDLLAVLPSAHPGYADLRDRFVAAVAALRTWQTSGGAWRNIIDQPSSYPESSTTAMVEAGVSQAVAAGVLGPEYRPVADAAWAAIGDRIDSNGHLVGVSYRPGVNDDPRRYEHTPAVGAYPWGQGAYLRAACARLRAATAAQQSGDETAATRQ